MKKAKPDRLVPPAQWDHKVLLVRKASLVLRALLARKVLQDRRGPKARQASKVPLGRPARRERQVFKALLDPKE